jgi:hypothetical protein
MAGPSDVDPGTTGNSAAGRVLGGQEGAEAWPGFAPLVVGEGDVHPVRRGDIGCQAFIWRR